MHLFSLKVSCNFLCTESLAYTKLSAIVNKPSTLNDVKHLSSEAQTSNLEGFHSTLNQWHPKMTHFSWLGTFCR